VVLRESINDFRGLEVHDFLGRNECCNWWSTRKETRVKAYVRDSSSACGLPKMKRKEGVYVVVLFHMI
jgi:hypothetical protein